MTDTPFTGPQEQERYAFQRQGAKAEYLTFHGPSDRASSSIEFNSSPYVPNLITLPACETPVRFKIEIQEGLTPSLALVLSQGWTSTKRSMYIFGIQYVQVVR